MSVLSWIQGRPKRPRSERLRAQADAMRRRADAILNDVYGRAVAMREAAEALDREARRLDGLPEPRGPANTDSMRRT